MGQIPEVDMVSWSHDSGHSMALSDRALQALDLMTQKGLGERPLLFICRSLGGLVAEQILRKASDAPDSRKQQVARQTRAVLFLATLTPEPSSRRSGTPSAPSLEPRSALKTFANTMPTCADTLRLVSESRPAASASRPSRIMSSAGLGASAHRQPHLRPSRRGRGPGRARRGPPLHCQTA